MKSTNTVQKRLDRAYAAVSARYILELARAA
jgi:hypothetical protein